MKDFDPGPGWIKARASGDVDEVASP